MDFYEYNTVPIIINFNAQGEMLIHSFEENDKYQEECKKPKLELVVNWR